MKADTRRVAVFIAVGLLLAIGVGIAVWRVGSPTSISVSETASTSSTRPDSSAPTTSAKQTPSKDRGPDPLSSANSASGQGNGNGGSGQLAAPDTNDPFLPPKAVLGATPQDTEPTVYYRPDNISGQLQTQQPSTSAVPQPATPEPSTTGNPTSAPSTTPSQSEQPSTSVPSSETSPTAPTAPVSDNQSPLNPGNKPASAAAHGQRRPASDSEPLEPRQPDDSARPVAGPTPTPPHQPEAPSSNGVGHEGSAPVADSPKPGSEPETDGNPAEPSDALGSAPGSSVVQPAQ